MRRKTDYTSRRHCSRPCSGRLTPGRRPGANGEPMANEQLKHMPLHDVHVALGAKMVPFAGFEMPVTYAAGISAEHKMVRENVGVFDVSHMGEFEVTGP